MRTIFTPFPVGCRVIVSEEGRELGGRYARAGRTGTVVGYSRNPDCARVLWDDCTADSSISKTFIERI